MAKKQSKRVLSKEKFDAIKTLQGAGLSGSKTAKAIGVSGSTASRVFRQPTYEAYQQFIQEYNLNRKRTKQGRPIKSPEPKQPQPTDQDLAAALNLLNDNLVLMSEKLEKYTEAVNQSSLATWSLRKQIKKPEELAAKKTWFGR